MTYLFILALAVIVFAIFNHDKMSYKKWYKRGEINAKHPDWKKDCKVDFMKKNPEWFVKNGYGEYLEERGDIKTITKQVKKEIDPEHMSIEEVCKLGGTYDQAAWIGAPHSANFVSGDDVISITGTTIESSWEAFRGSITIILNNEVLFNEDSSCIESYHLEVFKNGKFDKESEAFDYLINLFQGREFKQVEYAVDWKSLQYSTKRWDNPESAKPRFSADDDPYGE